MKKLLKCFTFIACTFVICLDIAKTEDWPCWRGPRGDGTSLEKNVPIHWSSSNICWKTSIPGVGHASPIVWGNRVFTVTALPKKLERLLLCFDRETGKILWQKTVLHAPLEEKHPDNSYASSTPATDGERVYVTFQDGNKILIAAYDFVGEQIWQVRSGFFSSTLGFCASPVVYKDRVIVNCSSNGDSYIVALDRTNGNIIWKIPLKDRTISFSVPLIQQLGDRFQMVLCGDKDVAGFDPNDGSRIWIVNSPAEEFVATPVYNRQARLLFTSTSHPRRHILAIKPDGSDNVTYSHVAWKTTKGTPFVPSPISEGDYFLAVHTSGTVYCYQAATGRIVWKHKLGKQYSSPVSANGFVYFLNDKGVMNVIKPGETYVHVAKSRVGEKTYASPAISEGQIFVRGEKHLFCIDNGID